MQTVSFYHMCLLLLRLAANWQIKYIFNDLVVNHQINVFEYAPHFNGVIVHWQTSCSRTVYYKLFLTVSVLLLLYSLRKVIMQYNIKIIK